MVFSATSRFTREDADAINSIKMFFGEIRTVDAQHQQDQLKKLMDAVDSVISSHGGIPFSNQMFSQIKVIKILVRL
jgi:hypothetical protein